MAENTTQAPQSSLDKLEAALKKTQGTFFVSEEENQQKIQDAQFIAKKLLARLRGEKGPKEYERPLPKEAKESDARNNVIVKNANITPEQQRQIDLATEQFRQSVQRVDNQLLQKYVQAVQDGDYAAAERILQTAEQTSQVNTLIFALLTIGAILLPLYAMQRLASLFKHFGLHAVYANTDDAQKSLREQAEKGAKSHINTVAKDIKNSLDDAIDEELKNPNIEAAVKDKFEKVADKTTKEYLKEVRADNEMYEYARNLVLQGESKQTIIKKLTESYGELSKRRAGVIAGNEANRVFTVSQFVADEQFLAQNKLTDKAYKRLISNTGNPCAICNSIIQKTKNEPIPFKQDFAKFGVEMSVKGDNGKTYKFTPNYEHLKSGHIHVNCHCRYELLIKQEDGSFINAATGKVVNIVDFQEVLHPRDTEGKFAKKKKTPTASLSGITNTKQFGDFIEEAYWDGRFGDYSHEVTESVRAYQGRYYDAINLKSRAADLDRPLTVYGRETTYQATVDNINAAATVELAEDTTLFRGTDIPFHTNFDKGDIIRSRSFLSTSVDKQLSDSFKYDGGSTLVITAKKGTKVILPDLVTFGVRGRTMDEGEVLIPTDSAMKIIRIFGDIVYAELI